jgi:hypothetical protein
MFPGHAVHPSPLAPHPPSLAPRPIGPAHCPIAPADFWSSLAQTVGALAFRSPGPEVGLARDRENPIPRSASPARSGRGFMASHDRSALVGQADSPPDRLDQGAYTSSTRPGNAQVVASSGRSESCGRKSASDPRALPGTAQNAASASGPPPRRHPALAVCRRGRRPQLAPGAEAAASISACDQCRRPLPRESPGTRVRAVRPLEAEARGCRYVLYARPRCDRTGPRASSRSPSEPHRR